MIIRKRNEPKKSLESFLFWQSLGMYFINREDFRQIFSIKYGDFFFFPAPPPPPFPRPPNKFLYSLDS